MISLLTKVKEVGAGHFRNIKLSLWNQVEGLQEQVSVVVCARVDTYSGCGDLGSLLTFPHYFLSSSSIFFHFLLLLLLIFIFWYV